MKDSRPFQSCILLYAGILEYSFCAVLSKLASSCRLLSPGFLVFYGASLLVLAAYAMLWQQILKRFPLTTAYSARPLVTVFGMVWGALFFQEAITANMLVGAGVIMFGIPMVVKPDEQ